MKIYLQQNNFKMDWSTGTAYIKTAPLIEYICLKYMSEIQQRINLYCESIMLSCCANVMSQFFT